MPEQKVEAAQKRIGKGDHSGYEDQGTKDRAHRGTRSATDKFDQPPFRRVGLLLGIDDCRLEFIAAHVAQPGVSHAALVDIFGPAGRKQMGAALRADVVSEC
jgi:hypothetical protein